MKLLAEDVIEILCQERFEGHEIILTAKTIKHPKGGAAHVRSRRRAIGDAYCYEEFRVVNVKR